MASYILFQMCQCQRMNGRIAVENWMFSKLRSTIWRPCQRFRRRQCSTWTTASEDDDHDGDKNDWKTHVYRCTKHVFSQLIIRIFGVNRNKYAIAQMILNIMYSFKIKIIAKSFLFQSNPLCRQSDVELLLSWNSSELDKCELNLSYNEIRLLCRGWCNPLSLTSGSWIYIP